MEWHDGLYDQLFTRALRGLVSGAIGDNYVLCSWGMDFPENYVPDQVDHPFWSSNHEVFEGMSSPANRDTE